MLYSPRNSRFLIIGLNSPLLLVLSLGCSEPSRTPGSPDLDNTVETPGIGSPSDDDDNDKTSTGNPDTPSSENSTNPSNDESQSNDDDDSDDKSVDDDDDSSDDDDDDSSDDDDDSDDPTPESTDKFDLSPIPDFTPPDRGCTIDFLFVIDNSGSMADEQDNLAQSVPQFIEILQNTVELEKFHLGVTASEPYIGNAAGCTSLGSLVKKTAGMESSNMSCAPYADGFGYMTPADDLSLKFPCAAKPGIGGSSDEKPMEAMMNAIGTDLAAPAACNENFLRDDESLLVVTIITDEEDDHEPEIFPGLPVNEGSMGEPQDWYNAVVQAKGQVENVVVLSLIGTEEPNECTITNPPGMPTFDGAEISERIKEFTELFGERGFVGDVCAASYGEFFKQAVEIIDFACDNIPQG